jgi:hypothetical protein
MTFNRFFRRLFRRKLASELLGGDVVWHYGYWRPVSRIVFHDSWKGGGYEVYLRTNPDIDEGFTIRVPPHHEFRLAFPGEYKREIHDWFSPSYSNYLVLQRSLLQSMPLEWQHQFVALLDALHAELGHHATEGGFWVRATDERGRFIPDPLANYERGRRKLPRKPRYTPKGK